MLDFKKTIYKEYWIKHNRYKKFDLNNEITYIKKKLPWLRECPSQSLQDQMRILTEAYNNFLSWRAKHPKFKKKRNRQSITFPQHCSIDWNWYILIPKIRNIKAVIHRWIPTWVNIKLMTIIKEANWQYYVSIVTDDTVWKPSTEKSVWIDMWLLHYAILSDWTIIDNPRVLKKSLKKLKHQQQKLSKKKKWSKNFEKQKIKVANVYFKINCQKNDFLHKLSRSIANKYWFVAVETLWIKEMMMKNNTSTSREISSASWWQFITYLEYKTNVFKIWRYEATSKTCSKCWYKKNDLSLKDRIYHCNNCWLEIDRDKNAAINILNIALKEKEYNWNCKVGTIWTV